jgi:diaminobutyrate-2-oxoglutarate transaminase
VNPEAEASDRGTCPGYPELARRIQAECMRRGLILELGGRNGCVVRFLPPLIVTAEQIDRIGEIFHAAVRASAPQMSAQLAEVSGC